MTFAFFKYPPCSANQIGQNDYFLGDGDATDFTLVNNVMTSLGRTVQAGNKFYSRSDSGVTGSGKKMTLSEAPGVGVNVIATNVTTAIISAYDRAPYPQTDTVILALGDITDIAKRTYTTEPGGSGIEIYLTNRLGGGGSDPTWFKLAPLNAADMSVGTFGLAGQPLTLDADINAMGYLSAEAHALDSTITVDDASSFVAGQWIEIPDGDDTDVVWLSSIVSNVLHLLQPLSYNHRSGMSVLSCAAGFALEVTIPNGIGGGIPLNLLNTSLDANFQCDAR